MFDDMIDDAERHAPGRVWPAWVVVPSALIWLGATFWAVIRVLLAVGKQASQPLYAGSFGFTFDPFGISVRPEVGTAVAIAVGPPALGLLIALCWRRPLVSVLLRLCVVLGGLSLLALAFSYDPPSQQEQDPPRGCVEYSGEPSDCP